MGQTTNTHTLVSLHEVVNGTTPGCLWFTTLDARNGYFQILLEPQSRDLTTFMTSWGDTALREPYSDSSVPETNITWRVTLPCLA